MRASLVALVGLLSLSACHRDKDAEGPMERAGKGIDNAAEKTGDALEKAAEKTGDALEKAGKKIKGEDAPPAASSSSAPAPSGSSKP
jgi:hypothetical protein